MSQVTTMGLDHAHTRQCNKDIIKSTNMSHSTFTCMQMQTPHSFSL